LKLSFFFSLSQKKERKTQDNKKHHQVPFIPKSSHKVPEGSISYRTDRKHSSLNFLHRLKLQQKKALQIYTQETLAIREGNLEVLLRKQGLEK
jgi:hypothetical protein